MNNNKQRLEMLDRLSSIFEVLPKCRSIREISKSTNIPTSTIQTYLHNDKLICELLGVDTNSDEYQEFKVIIQKWLDKAKKEGPSYGNKVLQERYKGRKR